MKPALCIDEDIDAAEGGQCSADQFRNCVLICCVNSACQYLHTEAPKFSREMFSLICGGVIPKNEIVSPARQATRDLASDASCRTDNYAGEPLTHFSHIKCLVVE